MKDKIVDIYLTPRFWKGEVVYDGRRPLLIYDKPSHIFGHINQAKPYPVSFTRRVSPQDGMLYELSQMKYAKDNCKGIGIKMLICVTMYNEPIEFLQRTLTGIYKNFRQLVSERGFSPKDIAVVIIQDGILKLVTDRKQRKLSSSVSFFQKIDFLAGKSQCKLISRINQILDEVDSFQRNDLGQFVHKNNGLPPSIAKNISLLYQFQWKPDREMQGRYSMEHISEEQPSLQIMACFKHLNAKKLSSHLWFFQGFCRLLNPQFCTLMDIGTQPYKQGLIHFLAALESDKNIGGVSGFMTLDIDVKSSQSQMKKEEDKNIIEEQQTYPLEELCSPIPIISTVIFILTFFLKKISKLIMFIFIQFFLCFHNLFSTQRAQLFQYNYSHMLDKNFQSHFKYLNVLPGAWSAYRYEAISRGDRYQQNLLQKKYLKMVLDPDFEQRDYKQANMYLAEDRILCLGIYCQKNAKFNLEYVPKAMAKTDPMDNIIDLMIQRRRWINSSYFAFDYVYKNYSFDVRDSAHDFIQKGLMLPIVVFFSKLSILNTYLSPAVFFFALYTSTHETFIKIRPPKSYFRSEPLIIIPALICFFYLATVCSVIIVSLFKKANQNSTFFKVTSAILGLYNLLLILIVLAFILFNYVFTQSLTAESYNTREVIKYLTIVNFGSLTLPVIAHIFTHPKQVLQMLDPRTLLSYLYYQAAYTHIFLIYGFCNVDDVSWGTKGSNLNKEQQVKNKTKEQIYYKSKIAFIGKWIVWNVTICFVFLIINQVFITQQNKAVVLIGIGAYSTANLTFRSIFALIHHFRIIMLQIFCQRRLYYNVEEKDKMEENLRKRTAHSFKNFRQHNPILPKQFLNQNIYKKQGKDQKFEYLDSDRNLFQGEENTMNKSNLAYVVRNDRNRDIRSLPVIK